MIRSVGHQLDAALGRSLRELLTNHPEMRGLRIGRANVSLEFERGMGDAVSVNVLEVKGLLDIVTHPDG